MTGEVQEWVKHCVEKYDDLQGGVLEIGSLDVCGNPRHHFSNEERFPLYIGIDQVEGNNVDRVMNSRGLLYHDGEWDVVLSLEMIEHDPMFWVSMKEMGRVLRPGGYLILTSRSWRGCGPHHTEDYWRFLEDGLKVCLGIAGCNTLETKDCVEDGGVFAIGKRRGGVEVRV